jgi:tetratricopeptide (TPR) repeat protein
MDGKGVVDGEMGTKIKVAVKIPLQLGRVEEMVVKFIKKTPIGWLWIFPEIGQVLLEGNHLKSALEAFELAGSSRQGAGNLAFNRAKILLLSDKPQEALDELQKYFDAQRTSKGREAYQLLADILQKLKRSDELIGRLESLAENDSQNVSLQYFLADRLTDVNELDRARKIY